AGSFTTNGQSITNLAQGATDTTTMVVTLNPTTAGTINGTFQILLASNGSGTSGLGITTLPDGTVLASGTITGQAGNLAAAGTVPPNPVNFGNVRINSTQSQNLTISNVAAAPAEGLNASFGTTSGAATNNGGSITSLAAAGSNNTTMAVGLNTS